MLKLNCPTCGKRLKVPDEMLGRRVGCSGCRGAVEVTAAAVAASAPEVLSLDDESVATLPRAEAPIPAPTPTPAPPQPAPTNQNKAGAAGVAATAGWLLADRLISTLAAIAIQATVFACIAFFAWGGRGADEGPGGEAGFGNIPGESLTNTDDGTLDDAPATAAADNAAELTTTPEISIAQTPTTGNDGLDLSVTVTPSGGGAQTGANDGFGFGGKGGGGEANFLGTSARGNRFCIIADNSGSMGGAPLEYVKAEILKTLGNARGSAKFYVIFFNSRAVPQPVEKWVSGKNEVNEVAEWIRNVRAEGGTEPITGFEAAFKLQPAPDVIYFMTDGGFDAAQVGRIKQLNDRLRRPAVVHTMAFLNRDGESLLSRIASQNRGTYKFVPGFNKP